MRPRPRRGSSVSGRRQAREQGNTALALGPDQHVMAQQSLGAGAGSHTESCRPLLPPPPPPPPLPALSRLAAFAPLVPRNVEAARQVGAGERRGKAVWVREGGLLCGPACVQK